MSLTIGVFTPEEIVLAADSRQSYQNVRRAVRIGSDNATKIFKVKDSVAVTISGPAFLVDPNERNLGARSIGAYINEFLNQLAIKENVESIASKIRAYLEGIYNPQQELNGLVEDVKKQITSQGGKIIKQTSEDHGRVIVIDYIEKDGSHKKGFAEVMPISLLIAGYDKNGDVDELNAYNVFIPGPTTHIRQHGKPNQFGANWTGQTDVVSRIVAGYDPRLYGLDFMQAATKTNTVDKIRLQLEGLEIVLTGEL